MNKLTDSFVLSDGVKVPYIGYGTYQAPSGDITKNCVMEALKVGYRHIDTAFAYGMDEVEAYINNWKNNTTQIEWCTIDG